jgi:hypothetical protein
MTADDLCTIRLIGLPLSVQVRAQEHADELTRELTLIAAQLRQEGNVRELPAVLLTVIEQLSHQYSGFTVEQEQQLADALARGDETIDLTYRVPASAGAAAQTLGDILDQADVYCSTGQHLLTLATPEDLLTYRRWFLSQFTNQITGAPPISWNDYLRQHAT